MEKAPKFIHQPQLFIILILNLVIFSFSPPLQAQILKKFRVNEVIQLNANQKVKILSCRGKGKNEECQVIYFTNERQHSLRDTTTLPIPPFFHRIIQHAY